MSAWRRQARAREDPEVPHPDYISYVSRLGSAELKRVARLWVGQAAYQANKAACTEAISAALEDPKRVRAFVAGLSEFERAVLGVLKARGGSVPPGDLASEVAALGLEAPPSRGGFGHASDGPFDLLNRLLEKGLILAASPSSAWDRPSLRLGSSLYYSGPELVLADRRLLAAVEAVPPRPLELRSLATAGASWMRRPGEAILNFLLVVDAVRRLGDLPATVNGQPSAAALKRLAKALGWNGRPEASQDTLGVMRPTPFYVGLLQGMNLLVFDSIERRLALGPGADARLKQPYREQARAWADAYRNLPGRFEDPDEAMDRRAHSDEAKLGAARGVLLQGLASLPGPPGAWLRCEAFSEALFERAGERVSLDYLPAFYAYHSKTPAEVQKKRDEWREGLRQRWRRLEGPWIADALRGPLYELGLVEVALAPGHQKGPPSCFRLTDLGRLALERVQAGEGTSHQHLRPDKSTAPCLIVQPNFEIVVYLDRAAPRLLAFLERAGERGSAGGATATYRLTRGSIYGALEAGAGIGALLKTLGEAAEHGLPENVETTLREWAARRDRLVVRRAVRLLEFPDAASRDAAAVSRGPATPLGERYILLDHSVSRRASQAAAGRSIDYGADPVRCLAVTEDGAVTLDGSRADLLVQAEVGRWADPQERGNGARWRITRESVARATRTGIGAEGILATLSARATHPCPPLLMAAIRAWGGAGTTAALASAILLHVPDREAFYAIATSPTLRWHLEGFLGSQTLVVNPGAREVLGRLLGELGLHLETELRPAQMPAMFEPRPFAQGSSTTLSRSPVAEREEEVEEVPLELGADGMDGTEKGFRLRRRDGRRASAKEIPGIALEPREELDLREEVIRAAGQDMKLLLIGQPGGLALAIGARRRRGRPRLRP